MYWKHKTANQVDTAIIKRGYQSIYGTTFILNSQTIYLVFCIHMYSQTHTTIDALGKMRSVLDLANHRAISHVLV